MIIVVLTIGLILRLISLNQSLWLDEAISLLASKQNSFWDFITQYLQADFHPPGYFIILWIWTHTFGFSEISGRFPSVIFGVATIWYVYKLGLLIKNKQLALTAALLIAVNPLHIYYSQEARMYEFAALASAMSFYYFLKLKESSRFGFLKYGASTMLLLSSDYVASLTILSQIVVLSFTQSKNWWKEVSKGWVLVILTGSAFLPLLVKQLKIGIDTTVNFPVWKEVVGQATAKSLGLTFVKFLLGKISFYNKILYGLIAGMVGLAYGWLVYRGLASRNKFMLSLMSWFIIPLALSFIISFWIPIFSYFRMLFILAPLVIIVALGIDSLSPKWRVLALTSIIATQLIFSGIYLFNPRFQRENWREVVSFLELRNPRALILFESNDSFSPFKYYAKERLQTLGALERMPALKVSDVANLKTKLNGASTIFLVDYLVDITDPKRLVAAEIEKEGYIETITHDFVGVGFIYEYTLK